MPQPRSQEAAPGAGADVPVEPMPGSASESSPATGTSEQPVAEPLATEPPAAEPPATEQPQPPDGGSKWTYL